MFLTSSWVCLLRSWDGFYLIKWKQFFMWTAALSASLPRKLWTLICPYNMCQLLFFLGKILKMVSHRWRRSLCRNGLLSLHLFMIRTGVWDQLSWLLTIVRPLIVKDCVCFSLSCWKSPALAHSKMPTSSLFPSRNDAPLLPVFISGGCFHGKPRAEDAGEESQGGRWTSSDGTRLRSGSGNVYWEDHGTPAAGTGGNWEQVSFTLNMILKPKVSG